MMHGCMREREQLHAAVRSCPDLLPFPDLGAWSHRRGEPKKKRPDG